MNPLLLAGVFALVITLFVLIFYRLSFRDRCPDCKHAHSIERVPRPIVVRTLLFYLPTQYFVCYSCMKRFLRIK
jgi:uncharacterized protein with PIN domain